MILISGDLPVLRFLEKTPRFFFIKKMVSISGDLPILRFLEKNSTLFSKKWSQYCWPARCELQKKSSYLEEYSSVGSQFIFFFVVSLAWDSVSQRFLKNWNYFGFRHTFPAKLVLWQYSLHVFVTYFGNIGLPFYYSLLRAPVSISLPDLSSITETCSTCYISYPFHAWWRDL